MNEEEIQNRIAHLESVNDQLDSEIAHFDELMKKLGFVNGTETVRETAQDIFEMSDSDGLFDDIDYY